MGDLFQARCGEADMDSVYLSEWTVKKTIVCLIDGHVNAQNSANMVL